MSLTWVDKLKVLDRWVERVLQYGRDNGASSMDSTAAKLRSFRAEKAKEISAAARSSR